MGEKSDIEENKETRPVDSPSNPFGSPTGNTEAYLHIQEMAETVRKLGDNYDKQFSQLSSKFESLYSMLQSNKSTVVGVDTEATVNKDTKKDKKQDKKKENDSDHHQ